MVDGKYINVPTKVGADLSNDILGSIKNFFFFPSNTELMDGRCILKFIVQK